MVLEVLADWKVSVHRNTELGEVIPRTHAWHKDNSEYGQFDAELICVT